VDILNTFCDGFMAQCVELLLSKFLHLCMFLLFDRFVCRQTVTCLKPFTRYGHYTGKVEELIVARLAKIVSKIAMPKIRAFSCGLMTLR